jgi:hypothetical protein
MTQHIIINSLNPLYTNMTRNFLECTNILPQCKALDRWTAIQIERKEKYLLVKTYVSVVNMEVYLPWNNDPTKQLRLRRRGFQSSLVHHWSENFLEIKQQIHTSILLWHWILNNQPTSIWNLGSDAYFEYRYVMLFQSGDTFHKKIVPSWTPEANTLRFSLVYVAGRSFIQRIGWYSDDFLPIWYVRPWNKNSPYISPYVPLCCFRKYICCPTVWLLNCGTTD